MDDCRAREYITHTRTALSKSEYYSLCRFAIGSTLFSSTRIEDEQALTLVRLRDDVFLSEIGDEAYDS
jgi:hypothetical protein